MHPKTSPSRSHRASVRANRWHTIHTEESIARARHNKTDKPKTHCDDCGKLIEGEPVQWEYLTFCEECGS